MTTGETRVLSIALDGTTLTAVWRRSGAEWEETAIACDAAPDSIARAFSTLADEAPVPREVRVTLLRPAAQTRTVDLPRSSRSQIERVLERDWVRYIVSFRPVPHTVAAKAIAANRWCVTFAPSDVLEAIMASCRELGWPVPVIQSTDLALASATRERDRKSSQPVCVIVCDDTGVTDGVVTRAGEPWVGRRFLPNAGAQDVLEFARDGARYIGAPQSAPMSIVLLGSATNTRTVATTLSTDDVRAGTLSVNLRSAAAVIAASGASARPTLKLLPTSAIVARVRRARVLTAWLLAASLAILITGLAIERAGIRRKLEIVQRARADIAAPVQQALQTRAALEAAVEAATALAAHERSRSRASGVLAAIVIALPPGTALTTLAIAGDSVIVEGESARGAAVYDAIRRVNGISGVRLSAPLRQERAVGNMPIEHFAFTARAQGSVQ